MIRHAIITLLRAMPHSRLYAIALTLICHADDIIISFIIWRYAAIRASFAADITRGCGFARLMLLFAFFRCRVVIRRRRRGYAHDVAVMR